MNQEQLFRLNLIRILHKQQWKQKELSKLTGIAESEISRMINGRIPLTIGRLAKICAGTGIEANEFYREDIVVDEDHQYTSVRLSSEEPESPKKQRRKSTYQKLEHRLTKEGFKKALFESYLKGYKDGRRAAAQAYTFSEEEISRVAEELIEAYRKNR